MKIGILGAGISGLSIARLLQPHFEVELLEQKKVPGGIARTYDVDGVAYHPVGGHCFNSKHQDVLDFVFSNILPLDQWHKIKRKSKIIFHNREIDYPIEFSVKQIYKFNKELALKIATDFLNIRNNDDTYQNMEDWLIKKFGQTLAYEYFIPYNTKIWKKHPSKLSPIWMEGKLPIPDKYTFFESLINNKSDKMPHAEFYYPATNNQNTFIDQLAKGLTIITSYKINHIEKNQQKKKWIVNNEKKYDLIISTLPLKELPGLMSCSPDIIRQAGAKLKFNKISNILWKTFPTDKTWTYVPDQASLFHRYIHIGSFFHPPLGYSITEAIGEYTFEELIDSGRKDPFLREPLMHNISDYAYVIFDNNYSNATFTLKNYMKEIGLYTLGRFGEWEYYNMDVCIKKAIELSKEILSNPKFL